MEEFDIFLNYPNLFQSNVRPSNCVIGTIPVTRMAPVLVQERSESEMVEDPVEEDGSYYLSWGSASDGEHRWQNRGSKACLRTVGPIKRLENDSYQFKVLTQLGITNASDNGYYYGSHNNKNAFGDIVRRDRINQIWLDCVPGLEDAMKEFVRNAHTRRERPPTQGSTPGSITIHNNAEDTCRVAITITSEQAAILSQRLAQEYTSLKDEKMSEYTVITHERLGMNSGKIPYRYNRPEQYRNEYFRTETYERMNIKTLVANQDGKKQKAGHWNTLGILGLSRGERRQDFPIDLYYNEEQEVSLQAVFAFRQHSIVLSVDQNRRNQVSVTRNTVFLPYVSGLVLVAKPKKITPGATFQSELLTRVLDQTKKRQIKGGYRGPYQGLSKLTYGEETLFQVRFASGLKAIASGEPIKNFKLDIPPRLPLSMEDYVEIERPMTNIKPIEVGHLNLYRISESPRKLVTGEILSDLQLPSMPDFMLAIDTDIRIESNNEYVGGSECSGDCQHENVNMPISPGLYVVKKKERCVISHDPGRPEYNVGFGTICNDGITIRRLLSQLNIHYDQFRGNMVGDGTKAQETDLSVSAGSLLGRFS